MDEELKSLITKIAWYYHVNEFTQQQISELMHISRVKVTRYLKKAKEMGIVKISVSSEYSSCYDKEEKLKELLGLQRVIIVPSGNSNEDTARGIGIAGAMHMNNILTPDDVLGVAWGETLYNVARHLNPIKIKNGKKLQVVQLMGGLSFSDKINPQEIVKLIAAKLNAQGYWLNIPAIVASKEARDILMNDESVAGVFDKTKKCNKCMFGLGKISETASFYQTGSLEKQDLEELNQAGAVGDILGRYFDINGIPVETSLTDKIIGVPLSDIKNMGQRVAFAHGDIKIKQIIGASRGKYIDELITDENTADGVIRYLEILG